MNLTDARIVHKHFASEGYLKSPPGYAIESFSSSLTPLHSPSGLSHISPVQLVHIKMLNHRHHLKAHVAPFRHGLLAPGSESHVLTESGILPIDKCSGLVSK